MNMTLGSWFTRLLSGLSCFCLGLSLVGVVTWAGADSQTSEASLIVAAPQQSKVQELSPEDWQEIPYGWYAPLTKAIIEEEEMGHHSWFVPINTPPDSPVLGFKLYSDQSDGTHTAEVETAERNYSEEPVFFDTSVKFDGRNLSFATNRVNGYWYSFGGAFINEDLEVAEGELALKGTLKKHLLYGEVLSVDSYYVFFTPICNR